MVGSRTPMEWWGKEKRSEVLKVSKKHIEEILKTVEKMNKAVRIFCDIENQEKIREASEEVMKAEREADKIKKEILDNLSRETFHPISREEIVRLIMTADDIADNAKGAAAKISLIDSNILNEELRGSFKNLAHLALESVELLESTYSTFLENPEDALEMTDEVEKLEEKIDYFRAKKLIPKIIDWADEINKAGSSIILVEIEDNIEEVADQTENVADSIRKIAISYSA